MGSKTIFEKRLNAEEILVKYKLSIQELLEALCPGDIHESGEEAGASSQKELQ
ncbi:MAG: hypothetical protein NTY48_04410 [Candidatus Diapherotrites archaeon]|nr:hypothetical protein [Candidatus Diapherotrites archaeon]